MDSAPFFTWLKENSKAIVGVLLIAFGLMLMMLTRDVFVYLIVFSVGFFMVYYGFCVLQFRRVTMFIDSILQALRAIISQN